MKFTGFLLTFFALVILETSCFSTKEVTYFNNAGDTTIMAGTDDGDNVIQKNDILSISVVSLNENADKTFNSTNSFVISTTSASGASSQSSGYLVNKDGNVEIPMLGLIKAEGSTKKQLKDNITKQLIERKLLVEPIVTVRHLNFEVTVVGEVGHPTVITVPSEKISLLKALGLAGDITIYGKKDNVLLIRESNGKRKVKRINLNTKEFLLSPYYYLQPNDVVYVEPTKGKVASVSRNLQILPTVLSALSFMLVIVVQLLKK
jgi:polysaccharide biosynthesis/export protein